jgi:hypothetical protein
MKEWRNRIRNEMEDEMWEDSRLEMIRTTEG